MFINFQYFFTKIRLIKINLYFFCQDLQFIRTMNQNTIQEAIDDSNSVRKSLTTQRQSLNIEQKIEPRFQQKDEKKYKNSIQFVWIAFVLAICSFQTGYALCQVAAVKIQILINVFNIPLSVGLSRGLLVGITPFGGIFSCILGPVLLRYFSRKNITHIASILCILSTVLIQITTFETILIGRFILGIGGGIYTDVAPIYIKQVTPPDLRALLGSFFGMARLFGIVFCFALGLAFEQTHVNQSWRILFAIPGILSLIQSILIIFFVPESPVNLVDGQKDQELQSMISKYYKQQHVDFIIKEYKVEKMKKKKKSQQKYQDAQTHEQDLLQKNKKRAFIMALHLSIYRQLMGVNSIVVYAGVMIQKVDENLALYANLLINSVAAAFTILSGFYLGPKFGRRPLYLSSGIAIGLSSYLVGIGYLIHQNIVVVVFMFLYMVSFSLLFTPVSWAYPTEIIPAAQVSIANIFNWAALVVALFVPPVIIQRMNGDAVVIFFFFGVYVTLSLIYMWLKLVQSKGKKYLEIIVKY